jgi:hypothetical protein
MMMMMMMMMTLQTIIDFSTEWFGVCPNINISHHRHIKNLQSCPTTRHEGTWGGDEV